MPLKGGFTFRQNVSSAYPDPDDPIAPDVVRELSEPTPCGFSYVWEYWLDLSRTRGSGFSAPEAMTYTELASWASLRPDVFLTPQIVDMIIRIDGAFRRAWSERNKPEKEGDNG